MSSVSSDTALLFHMLHTQAEDHAYMFIIQSIEDCFSFSSELYQLGILQDTELMTDRRLAEIQDRCHIADTQFRVKQRIQDLDPGGIPEYLK